jgi:ribosomal protein L32E
MIVKRRKAKFLRTDFSKFSKLGVRRKKKQVYRKSKGRDNKIRLNMKGHTTNVRIGYRTKKQTRDLIDNLKPVMIHNIADLKKITKESIGIIGKIGSKKRKQILEQAQKDKVRLTINTKKALEKIENKLKQAKERKKKIQGKKIARDKKAQKEAEKKAKKQAKEERKQESGDEKEKPAEKSKQDNKKAEVKEVKPTDSSAKKEIKSNNYGRGN